MASTRPCLAQLSRLCISASSRPAAKAQGVFLQSITQTRGYAQKGVNNSAMAIQARQKAKLARQKKHKPRTSFKTYDLKDAEKFALCDAMRYLRAAEVGQAPTAIKYDLAVKLKTLKNGPVVRGRVRLPNPVSTDTRICVICPPDSPIAKAALAAGAHLVGEEEIFEAVKDGKIEFDRCIAHIDSVQKLNKAGLGRVLGPRGLMPAAKNGTVVKDPAAAIKEMIGAAEYREKLGVVRMPIGQLGFTPEQMQDNIKLVIEAIKKDVAQLSERVNKEIAEVVLSTTNGPGITLSGDFRDPKSDIKPEDLTVL